MDHILWAIYRDLKTKMKSFVIITCLCLICICPSTAPPPPPPPPLPPGAHVSSSHVKRAVSEQLLEDLLPSENDLSQYFTPLDGSHVKRAVEQFLGRAGFQKPAPSGTHVKQKKDTGLWSRKSSTHEGKTKWLSREEQGNEYYYYYQCSSCQNNGTEHFIVHYQSVLL